MRQAANLGRVQQVLPEQLRRELGARTADGPSIDGFPIKVCHWVRAPRSQNLKVEADYGYCAAKDEYYSGLQANVLIDPRGVGVGITSTAANGDERASAYEVLPAMVGVLLGDKGYIRPPFKADCEAVGIDLQPPVRKHMIEQRPPWWLKRLRRVRQRVETVISQLEPRFGLAKTRAREAWPLTNPVTRKLLAPTIGVWLNIQQGREPLQLDGVVTA